MSRFIYHFKIISRVLQRLRLQRHTNTSVTPDFVTNPMSRVSGLRLNHVAASKPSSFPNSSQRSPLEVRREETFRRVGAILLILCSTNILKPFYNKV